MPANRPNLIGTTELSDPCQQIRNLLFDLWEEWAFAERAYGFDPDLNGYYDLLQRQIEDANYALADCERRLAKSNDATP